MLPNSKSRQRQIIPVRMVPFWMAAAASPQDDERTTLRGPVRPRYRLSIGEATAKSDVDTHANNASGTASVHPDEAAKATVAGCGVVLLQLGSYDVRPIGMLTGWDRCFPLPQELERLQTRTHTASEFQNWHNKVFVADLAPRLPSVIVSLGATHDDFEPS
jgi:hypothetical protein